MSESPWQSFESAVKEEEPLPPLVVDGEEFVFPGSPPSSFAFKLLNLVDEHSDKIPDSAAVGLIPELLGEDRAERLKAKTTMRGLMAILDDLLRQYGFGDDKEGGDDPPNP